MPSRSTPSWISAFENGPSTQPIFVYHPQGKLQEVQYARRVPTFEDKVAQRAIVMVLEPIYEQDFLPCSFGFRPRRSAHQALSALRLAFMGRQGLRWVIIPPGS